MAVAALLPRDKNELQKSNKNFREFLGINTQAKRQAIDEKQFAWLENAMPVGYANLAAIKQISETLVTFPGESVYYQHEYNISNTPFMFVACTSGSAYQINLLTNAKTLIAAAATFPSSGTQIAQWKNERILIINATNYFDWNGASLSTLGGTTSAPTAGQCIATFAGRVWISNGRTINFSQPSSYTNFSAPGGNTIITDSVLTSDIKQLLAANNFLYFFGDDSINVIADVQVNSAGTATLFSNTNISANSGTNLAQSIFPYFRAIWYMNSTGVYGLYGATPRKASDDLDGIFENIDFSAPVTGGTVEIFQQLCASFMFTYNDPDAGARKLIAVYFNKKWFLASQNAALTRMATANVNAVDTMYGTDGDEFFRLFDDDEAEIDQLIVTALWDCGSFIQEKQALKLGIELDLPEGNGEIFPTVDTERASQAPGPGFNGSFAFVWYNSLGDVFSWVNSLNNIFTWFSPGYAWVFGDVETQGHYLGVTIESAAPKAVYSGIQLQYRLLPGSWWS